MRKDNRFIRFEPDILEIINFIKDNLREDYSFKNKSKLMRFILNEFIRQNRDKMVDQFSENNIANIQRQYNEIFLESNSIEA